MQNESITSRIASLKTEAMLKKLSYSKFRSGFHLTGKEKAYFKEKGEAVIRIHTEDFIRQRIAPKNPKNDGRQTPMSGHPSFKAMHATACCCRGCLEKWHKIPQGRELSKSEVDSLVDLIMSWILKQI